MKYIPLVLLFLACSENKAIDKFYAERNEVIHQIDSVKKVRSAAAAYPDSIDMKVVVIKCTNSITALNDRLKKIEYSIDSVSKR